MPEENTIVSDFLSLFPELSEHPGIKGNDYTDTPYAFFGVIRDILEEEIGKQSGLSKRILKWLDTTINSIKTNSYVYNMLWIEFFEGAEINDLYRVTLLSNLNNRANLNFRQYLYIMANGGLTDSKTGEILTFVKNGPSIPTGKYISDIK